MKWIIVIISMIIITGVTFSYNETTIVNSTNKLLSYETSKIKMVDYTPSSMTECLNNICTKTLYSSNMFVNEDSIWKPLKQARSLKDKGFIIVYLENDKIHDLEVVDFNYTSITIKPFVTDSKELNKDIPIKMDNVILKTTKITDVKTKSEEIINVDNILAHNFTFGEHSTTVIVLQTPETQNLEDTTIINAQLAGTGSQAGVVKFNITLPSGATILNSKLGVYGDGTGSGFAYRLDSQAWIEEWSASCVSAGNFNGLNTSNITAVTFASGWFYINVTNMTVYDFYNGNINSSYVIDKAGRDGTYVVNGSGFVNTTNCGVGISGASTTMTSGDISSGYGGRSIFTKEYTTDTAKRPKLEITYFLPDPPIYSYSSTNTTSAGNKTEFHLNWTKGTYNFTGGGFNFSWCNGTGRYIRNVSLTDNETGVMSFKQSTIANTTHIYNYTDSTNNRAYWASPAGRSWANFMAIGTQATANHYTNISSPNGIRSYVVADASNDEPVWRFNFTIREVWTSVNWVYTLINGYTLSATAETASCYVANFTTNALNNWTNLPKTSSANQSKNWTLGSDLKNMYNTSMSKFMMGCVGDNFDVLDNDRIFIDYVELQVNYNLTYNETNQTYVAYNNIGGENYSHIDKVNATIEIKTYNPTASNKTFFNNKPPDIEVNFWNSTAWVNSFYCNISQNIASGNQTMNNNTSWNCSITTTNTTILTAWQNTSNRKIQIRGINMDLWNNTVYDEINVSGVWGYVDAYNDSVSCDNDYTIFSNDSFIPLANILLL